MTDHTEFEPKQHWEIEQVYAVSKPHLDALIPVAQMKTAIALLDDPESSVHEENGMVVRDETIIFPVPTKEDIATAQARLDAVDAGIRTTLGISEDIDVGQLEHVAFDVFRAKSNEPQGYNSEAPWVRGTGSVPDFLRATQAVSRLIGEGIEVWINKYRMGTEVITPATDIEELVARAKQLDLDGVASIHARPHYTDEQKSYHSPEIVESWY